MQPKPTLQTALVNWNLSTLDGSDSHIVPSILEHVVWGYELLCPAITACNSRRVPEADGATVDDVPF